MFIASVIYATVLLYCMAEYASVEWYRYGHSFGGLSVLDKSMLVCALAAWSALVPTRLNGPSSVVLVVIYLAVCIPGVVVPLGMERAAQEQYHPLVLSLIVAFSACCIFVRLFSVSSNSSPRKCSPGLVHAMLGVWIACLATLIFTYGSVMTLVSLDAIYDQRAAGAATNRFMGYVQTYFGYVLSPAILAFGLVRRNAILVLIGFAGGVLLYSVTAEKNAFAFPFLLVAFYYALTRRAPVFQSSAFVVVFLSLVLGIAVFLHETSFAAAFVAWYLGVRSLLTPGSFIAQYFDFFSYWGFTRLSHVTGFGWVIAPPPAPGSDDRWPSLGHLVGEQLVGIPDLNANANFVASDGIASFGVAGVFLSFMLLAAFLIALERGSAGISRRFMALIALPIGLILTNVSIFTVFLSFGGLFWLIVMALFFKTEPAQVSSGGVAVGALRLSKKMTSEP